MSQTMPIRIRAITQLDVPFVMNAWLKSFKGAFFAKDIHPKTYFGNHHLVLQDLLQSCTTLVACSESDPTEIYGFITAEYQDGALVLHYIYVKHTFRNLGIAGQLLAQFPVSAAGVSFYTHHNAVAHKQAAAYHLLYNPYLAFLPKYRANKPSNYLDLNTKVKESENDESEFKQHHIRGSTPGKRRTQGSAGEGEAAD